MEPSIPGSMMVQAEEELFSNLRMGVNGETL